MGSASYLSRNKSAGYKAKSGGSSAGSEKEMSAKLRRAKIRRPTKLSEYGLKRVPDYTDIAYKEAVSKLRYFLSGNYAPSLRSYGGSASIKNLDESDGDLDRKYTPYTSNALQEYRPRPRLTAKYTTLYADSLNYNPKVTTINTAAPAPAPATVVGETTGGTNPDVINFIQKQEEYIEQLERESQYCRDELNNLLGKVKEVISENEHLHEAQKNKLISRMIHSYNAGSETDDLDDSTGLDSDHKATPSKARKATKIRPSKLEGPNIVFESRIAELEAQLAQAQIHLKKIQDENNENKRKLASGLVDSTCLDGFKRQIDNLQRDKSNLESQISKLKIALEQKDGDLEGRFKRGSDVVEQQLREERNNLEAEVRRLKDELAKERSRVRELAGEGARRAMHERSAAEQRYNEHFDELQHDLAAQYDNVAKLQLELERQRREENELKRELSMKNNAIEELKMELKNKTASLQADLSQSQAEKASVDEELASARLAIERQQRQGKHEVNRLNSEIQSLRQRLDRADADLVHARRENLRLAEQIANLEKELNMKSLTPLPTENKKEKEISSALENIENKHAKTVAELESMIQTQNSLMEKLTGECRLLTDKLDDANRRHKQELGSLQRQVECLQMSLQSSHPTPRSYDAPTSHTSPTNKSNIITNTTALPGQDYPRTDSAGYSNFDQVQLIKSNRQNGHQQRSSSRSVSRQSSRNALIIDPGVHLSNSFIEHPTGQISEKNQQSEKPTKQLENITSIQDNQYNTELNVQEGNDGNQYETQKYTNEISDSQNYNEVNKQQGSHYGRGTVNQEETPQAEYVSTQQYEPQTEQYDLQQYSENYDPNYQQENAQYGSVYDPNIDQTYASQQQYENYATDPNYLQNYDQTYDQQYQDPQFQETPQDPQYVDPTAQYPEQYENYSTEQYETQQNYDNSQQNTEQSPPENASKRPETSAKVVPESKRNSPNRKLSKS